MQVVALGVRDRAYENARGHEAVKLAAEVASREVESCEVENPTFVNREVQA